MEYKYMEMDEEQTELIKRAIAYYIGLRMGEDCTCLPDHDACEFCRNKNAYHRMRKIVEKIENGDWSEDADDILNKPRNVVTIDYKTN